MTRDTTFGSAPPKDVLDAFGVSGTPTALKGGQGFAWRVDQVVLKPADTSERSLAWQARVLSDISPDSIRVGRPERSRSGDFIVAGWSASAFCVSLAPYRDAPHVARLEGCLKPVQAPSQVIHGDLTGNVLFADPLPPAVIDLSPYWRPSEFATAIVVADAIVWEEANEA